MKFLVLLFLVGCAAAYRGDGLDRTLEGQVRDLLGDPAFLTVYHAEDDTKTELGKKLREALDDILERVKEAVDHGKTVREDVLTKLKEIKEKMKEMKIDAGDKARELYQKIKDRAKDFLKNLLDRLGLKDDKEAVSRGAVFVRQVERIIQNADDDDIKTEMGKKLREALDQVMEKVKESIEQGKQVKQDVLDKLKDLKEKMKEMKIDMGEKARELYEKIKDRAKDYLKDLLDKLGLRDSKSDVARADFNIKSLFKKLKKTLLDTIDKEKLKEKIEQFFGKGNELADQLLNMLKEKGDKGKQKLLDLVDKILGEDEDRETRSLQELREKVKEYFKNLKIELKDKYLKFGEWVKEQVRKGIDHSKSKLENIKAIAKEFVDHAKEVRKDVAAEALEFLRLYKDDLGTLWDQVKQSVKEVLNRDSY